MNNIRNNDILLSSSNPIQPNFDNNTKYQSNSDTLNEEIDSIGEQLKNLSGFSQKIDVPSNPSHAVLNNGSEFGIIGDQRHNQNMYSDSNIFMFNQMKPVLNGYPITNKGLSQSVNSTRIGNNFGNMPNFNINTSSPINNINMNNMNSINGMNNINNINNMNNMNNMVNINGISNINNINTFPLNIHQKQELIMGYNSNISSNPNMNSKSYLFNTDSYSPTNNPSNILRVNNVTPTNSTITTTSSLETPLSDMSDMLSSNNSNSSNIKPVSSHNFINMPNTPINNYNNSISMNTNNTGNLHNVNNNTSQSVPLKIIKSNTPPLPNKNTMSNNTPVLSSIQMLNDKSSNSNLNNIKIKNKNSFGGISTNSSSSTPVSSNEYIDNYHRRITMEERRMCQSSDENRKNSKNGGNNMNLNDRQLNQSSSSKRHVIPRGNELILSRVISGLDDRTTFMIRNIPNKYSKYYI